MAGRHGRVRGEHGAGAHGLEAVGVEVGERVLDLCAAPGNKTARLAVEMGDRGLVVANDVSAGRLPGLRRVVERLGLTSIAVTRGDAARLPAFNEMLGRAVALLRDLLHRTPPTDLRRGRDLWEALRFGQPQH